MKIINRCAGCGKIEQIVADVQGLLHRGVSAEKISVLSLNRNLENILREKFSEIKVFGFQSFTKNIFGKMPNSFEITCFSDDLSAIYFLQEIIKIYTKNTELENLGKISAFAREIYNLIGVLKANKIDVNSLTKACIDSNLEDKEAKRFDIIIKIYEQYEKMLKAHNFADFRDVVISVSEELKTNDFLKNEISYQNEYLFVAGAENISAVQLEFLTEITDESKIFLYGDENARIETFMGASVFGSENIAVENIQTALKKDIFERALYIINPENKISTPCENIEYTAFSDFEDEINFIADDIKKSIEKFGYKMSDFAVLIRDNDLKQNISDLFAYKNIKINGEQYNDDFQYFKFKLMNIINIFDIMHKLKIEKFDYDSFKMAEIKAKEDKLFVELKVFAEQLNLFYESILAEKIVRPYNLNMLKNLKDKESEIFLPCSVLKNTYKIPQPDKNILENLSDEFKKFYMLYKQNRFLELIAAVSELDKNGEKSYSYNLFLAKFMKRVDEINRVKNKISTDIKSLNPYEDCDFDKPNIDFQIINDLLNVSIKEAQNDEKINLLTIFEANGRKFKKVYIPNLADEYFPKMSKSTSFISKSADEKISEELRKSGAENFSHLIDTKEDDIKGEQSLMYVAMTSALEKLVLTTHKVINGKNVLPSLFFEQLAYFDGFSFDEKAEDYEKLDLDKDLVVIENTINEKNDENVVKPTVLQKNESLHLSASQIANYQKCPKRFYYSNLLGLKGKSTFAASFGTAVHEIMRMAYSHRISDMNSKENVKKVLTELGNILFDSVKDDECLKKAVNAGFEYVDPNETSLQKGEKKSEILNQLRELNILDVEVMRKDFLEILDNLENVKKYTGIKINKDGSLNKKGDRESVEVDFYSQIPRAAACEKPFRFSFPKEYELENVEFGGFIDAFIKYDTGWNLLDYKTGQNEMNLFGQISENNLLFQNVDMSGFSENEKNKILNDKQKCFSKFKYQTVLYYFACLFDEQLQKEEFSKIDKLGYLYLRTQRKYDGSQEEIISAEILKNLKENIIKSIKDFVVTPIFESSEFAAKPNDSQICKDCFYNDICDVEEDDEDENSGEDE